jgi:O-acetyl-ADP-ribose deacetylase
MQSTAFEIGACRVELLKGDITRIPVDAIVNAANSALMGGGGVDGAIHDAGGPAIMRELDELRKRIKRCETGSAVVTGAGNLPAIYVIHAVGPIYRDGTHDETKLLESCYHTSLELARERSIRSISFPSISTGAYGFPVELAAPICLETITSWLRANPEPLRKIKLVQFSESDHQVYLRAASAFAALQS